MKRTLISLVFAVFSNCVATEIEVGAPPEPEKTWIEEAEEVAAHINDLEMCLREDRTDSTVQIKGKEIDDELERLIKRAEAEERKPKPKKGPKDGTKPDKDSTLDEAEAFAARMARMGEIERARWINLPSVCRGEIVQVYATDLPMKWKERVGMYFASIARAEAASLSRKGAKEQRAQKEEGKK